MKVQKETKSKIPLGLKYCFDIDRKNDSNKTKGTSYNPFPKDHVM